MTLLHVMNKYHISIYHASLLLDVREQTIVRWLLETHMAEYLEECFLKTREQSLL